MGFRDKLKRGGVLGTFSKAVAGGCQLNFSASGSGNCDDSCRHKGTTCYAERIESRFDRKQLLAKLRRHEVMPAWQICGAAIIELQDLKRRGHQVRWLRISSAGSLPQPDVVREDKLFRTQFRGLLAYCRHNAIPVHVPVESYAKARFYRALAGDLVVVRESTQSMARFVSATDAVAGVAGTRDDSLATRMEKARQLARLRFTKTGRKCISCPAVEASFKRKLGMPFNPQAKCGKCDVCAKPDIDVVYALHEEREPYRVRANIQNERCMFCQALDGTTSPSAKESEACLLAHDVREESQDSCYGNDGDDLCDMCMRSNVVVSRTDADGNTICVECADTLDRQQSSMTPDDICKALASALVSNARAT